VLETRVIPCLLLRGAGLVKTVKFKDPKYLGDPINVVKIFNDKEVDELVILDIDATPEGRRPSFDLIAKVASQCFMPLCYGGGVRSVEDMRTLFGIGIEKVAVNSFAVQNPVFIREAADRFGSQSVIVSIDVKRSLFGRYEVVTHGGRKQTGLDPVALASTLEAQGVGEIFLNSVDQDGTMEGYDLDLVRRVTGAVRIPVIACGGAGKVEDLVAVVGRGGASAAAAGSLFVFQMPHRAVLISYLSPNELQSLFRTE